MVKVLCINCFNVFCAIWMMETILLSLFCVFPTHVHMHTINIFSCKFLCESCHCSDLLVECTENKTQNVSLTLDSPSSSVNYMIAVRSVHSKFHLTYVIRELLLNCFKNPTNPQILLSVCQETVPCVMEVWHYLCFLKYTMYMYTESHLCYAGYSVTNVSGERFLSHGVCVLFCLVKLRQ